MSMARLKRLLGVAGLMLLTGSLVVSAQEQKGKEKSKAKSEAAGKDEKAKAASSAVVKVDPTLDPYKETSGISGNLSSVGSDTMNNLITLWAEAFRKYYPS